MRIDYTPPEASEIEYVEIKECYVEIKNGIFTQRDHYISREIIEPSTEKQDYYRDHEVRVKVSLFAGSTLGYISDEDHWRIRLYFSGVGHCP